MELKLDACEVTLKARTNPIQIHSTLHVVLEVLTLGLARGYPLMRGLRDTASV